MFPPHLIKQSTETVLVLVLEFVDEKKCIVNYTIHNQFQGTILRKTKIIKKKKMSYRTDEWAYIKLSGNAWIPRAQIFGSLRRAWWHQSGGGPRSERGGRMAVEPGAPRRGTACPPARPPARPGDDRACQTVCYRARKCEFNVPVSYIRSTSVRVVAPCLRCRRQLFAVWEAFHRLCRSTDSLLNRTVGVRWNTLLLLIDSADLHSTPTDI